MPSHPVYRAARAVVFATVCVGLAITGHTMAAPGSVPAVAAIGGLVAMTAIGAVLGGHERSFPTILIGLLGGQFMLHAMFVAAQQGQYLAHGGVAPRSPNHTAMSLAHVVAAVVSAWWLRRGERATWGLARWIATALMRPIRALRPAPVTALARHRHRPVPDGIARPRAALLRHVVVRRGPPSSWTTHVLTEHRAFA